MTTPKNGSSRRIDVSRQLADSLKGLLVERKKQTLKQGWGELPPWVFVNEAGKPVDPENFRNRIWPKLLTKSGLRHFPIHSLRHTFASRLLQNGTVLLYVQHAMGHHSAAFTLQVYGHFQPNGSKSEVDKLDNVVLPGPGRTLYGPAGAVVELGNG